MRMAALALFVGGLLAVGSFINAQPPGGGKGGKGGDKGAKGGFGGPGGGRASSAEEMVTRLMAFDKNNDGKLSKDEVTDERLKPLFDRADANKKGVLTKDELTAFFTKEMGAFGAGGPGGPGGPGGGFGMGGGFGPPALGQVMPVFLQDQLKLTDAQKKQLEAIQKDVDAKLEKLMTEEQRKTFKAMKERGPGGPGGPGGFPGGPGGFPGGPGGPGGFPGGPGGPGGNPPPPPER
ncbi:secreted protein : Uncharacterized protein OS=Singulisphaera acidiphila (strain ATCC BAA-1392 / DSM 18658 / VKM B-2454 / MOB10) GN=Sinac_2097 PE=4 SV=1: EF-hand_5: EF-hand_5 [Gemmata massiliana]|uniref:EF-hand domain-containing protein n=1 Tax=Gemmata massiliana TaxID=1210884 RepID=A0A6P2CR81_9BACT|nr:Spy/CpxP family protein refolding chaperone [Gemmata massiliana]VTR91067.1 secreted protein : Uncharacterized protein OS=Singulisphaera acidiphila (strain ATCC BAA-1392 / DSM 18658 / VKM B-2454 / MOB10) GN=Sinac_2097 PE=4 SV=1: EF-hand_5: EF-hand_5 [Gemmata massiliana]